LRAIVGILDGTYDDIGKKLKTDTDGFHFEDQADTDRINFQFLKDYYNVCLNTDLSAQLGPTPIFADIALIQKELFPIDSTTTHLSLANTLAFFVRRGVPSSLITVDYEVNELDHAIRTAKFVAPVKSLNSFKDLTKALDMVWSIFGEPLADNGHAAFIHQESQKAGFTLWSKERVKAAAQNYIEISQKISSAASE
jgi:hypothetical protein